MYNFSYIALWILCSDNRRVPCSKNKHAENVCYCQAIFFPGVLQVVLDSRHRFSETRLLVGVLLPDPEVDGQKLKEAQAEFERERGKEVVKNAAAWKSRGQPNGQEQSQIIFTVRTVETNSQNNIVSAALALYRCYDQLYNLEVYCQS